MAFDYTNPEKAIEEAAKRDEIRRKENLEKKLIPEQEGLEVKCLLLNRTESGPASKNPGSPMWTIEVAIIAPGKPYNKEKKTFYYPDHVDSRMTILTEMLRLWGMDFSRLRGLKLADAEMKFLEMAEEIIDQTPRIKVNVKHRPDVKNPNRVNVNFWEDLDSVEQVVNLDLTGEEEPEDESQEIPEAEEVQEEVKEEAPKPARPRIRSPYSV